MLRVVFLLLLIMQGKLSYNIKRTLLTTTPTVASVKQNNVTNLVKIINSTVAVTCSTISVSIPSYATSNTTDKKENLRRRSGQTKLYPKTGKKRKNILKSIIPFTEAPLSIFYLDEKSVPNVKKSISKSNQITTDINNSIFKECIQPISKGNTKQSSTENPKLSKLKKLTSARPGVPNLVYNSQIYEPIHEEDSELETYKDPYYTEKIVPMRLTSGAFSNKRITYLSSKYGNDPDNPVFGDQAFFSFILNDYFDRNIEDEPKLMEDVRWGKDFDKELTSKRDAKRVRRLENNTAVGSTESSKAEITDAKLIKEVEQIIKNLKTKPNIKLSDNHKEFKSIVDMFAAKFGSNKKNNETVSLKKREDVIENNTLTEEKDELQEAGELLALMTHYNSDNKMEENVTENVLTTLSEFEQFLNAHETQSEIKKPEDYKDASNILSRLRHVAKNVALVNNADYIDTLENMLYRK